MQQRPVYKLWVWPAALAILAILVSYTTATGTNPSVGSPVTMSPVQGGGTYPRITRLSNGNLLAIYTRFSNGQNILQITQSTNNGQSWQETGTVTTGVGDIDNGFLLELPTTAPGASHRRILAAFRNHSKDSSGAYTYFRITVCYSDDGGITWAFLSEVEGRNPPEGIWEPFMRMSADGSKVQIYYARENASNDQDIVMRTSSDRGVTWSNFATVAGATTTGRDGMPGVTQYHHGTGNKLLCIFETTEGGTGNFMVKSVTSSDDGATWGNRALVYSATGSTNNAGAPGVTTVGNDLVAIFMTDEDTSQHQWVNGADVKSLVSTSVSSSGITWGNKITVSPVQSNWPGIMTLDNSHALASVDHGGVVSIPITLS